MLIFKYHQLSQAAPFKKDTYLHILHDIYLEFFLIYIFIYNSYF